MWCEIIFGGVRPKRMCREYKPDTYGSKIVTNM